MTTTKQAVKAAEKVAKAAGAAFRAASDALMGSGAQYGTPEHRALYTPYCAAEAAMKAADRAYAEAVEAAKGPAHRNAFGEMVRGRGR